MGIAYEDALLAYGTGPPGCWFHDGTAPNRPGRFALESAHRTTSDKSDDSGAVRRHLRSRDATLTCSQHAPLAFTTLRKSTRSSAGSTGQQGLADAPSARLAEEVSTTTIPATSGPFPPAAGWVNPCGDHFTVYIH